MMRLTGTHTNTNIGCVYGTYTSQPTSFEEEEAAAADEEKKAFFTLPCTVHCALRTYRWLARRSRIAPQKKSEAFSRKI